MTQPARERLMKNVSKLSQEERMYRVKREGSGFRVLMRRQQSNIVPMKGAVQIFTKPENLSMDDVSRTFSIAEAGMHVCKT